MEWIIPAISIDCGFKLAVALILFVSYFETKQKVIFWWAMGWFFFGLHNVTELISVFTKYEPLWFIHHSIWAFTAVAFLESVGHMRQPTRKIWHIAAATVGIGGLLSSYIGVFVVRNWYTVTIPTSFLNGLGFIICAFYFLRFTEGENNSVKIVIFLGFLLNGLHNLDYPFLRPISWFAPIGFGLGVIFSIIFAVGLIMMSIEQIKKQREESKYIACDIFFLNSISAIVNRIFNLEEILNNVLTEIVNFIKADMGGILFIDEENKYRISGLYKGMSENFIEIIERTKLEEKTFIDRILRRGESIYIGDIAKESDILKKTLKKEKVESFIAISLKSKDKIMGMIIIAFHKNRVFSKSIIQLLISIGNTIGVAIDNAMLYKRIKNWNEELEKIISERIKDSADGRKATLNMLEDISESYTQLRNTQDQLVQSEKMAIIGEMAAKVGHEVRNPLASIKVSVYYLNKKLAKSSPEITKTVENIEKEVKRAADIITNILEFSRPSKLDFNLTDINIMLEETLDAAQKAQRLKNIKIIKKLDVTISKVPLAAFRFRQALDNIILNASQSMENGGELTIQTSIADNKLEIRISDKGIGIDKENLKSIFNPFFTNKSRGLGLGLAIVNEIVKGHQGTIKVESRLGEGSTFIIRLPLKKEK